jgi:hypothetical protein
MKRCCYTPHLHTWFACLSLLAAASSPLSAQLILEFGDPVTLTPVSDFHILLNEGNQMLAILVRNDGGSPVDISGMTLEVTIAGGGPILGGSNGPQFTSADLLTGTPFQTDHGTPAIQGGPNPVPGLGSVPQFLGLSITTDSPGVGGNLLGAVSLKSGQNLLATVTVDTTGFTGAQSWSLDFGTANSFFTDPNNNRINPGFENSLLTQVPESQHYGLVIAMGLLILTFVRLSNRASLPNRGGPPTSTREYLKQLHGPTT